MRRLSVLIALCTFVLVGCSSTGQSPVSPMESAARFDVAQVGDAEAATFVFCIAPDCARPSLKTPVPFPRAVTLPHPPAPVARLSPVGESATPPLPAPPLSPPVSVAVFFRTESAHLDAVALRALDGALPGLLLAQSVQVRGYTDDRGAERFNDRLARRRAEAVVTWLGSRGIPESRVDADGDGRCCYVESNATTSGRQANRRAVITLSNPSRSIP